MFRRAFPASCIASAVFVGSAAGFPGVLAAPTNPQRAELKLQGADAFLVSAYAPVNATSGLFYPSGGIHVDQFHVGPVYVQSQAVNGATIAVRTWESSM